MAVKPEEYLYNRVRRYKEKLAKTPDATAEYINNTMDSALSHGAGEQVAHVLSEEREKGRHGWWDEDVISDGLLRELLDKAYLNSELDKVMVFAAMLEARKYIQMHKPGIEEGG